MSAMKKSEIAKLRAEDEARYQQGLKENEQMVNVLKSAQPLTVTITPEAAVWIVSAEFQFGMTRCPEYLLNEIIDNAYATAPLSVIPRPDDITETEAARLIELDKQKRRNDQEAS